MSIMSIGGGVDPSARKQEQSQQQFDIADTNQDGTVSATEFMEALTTQGVESTKSADMFSNMDGNGDGNLSQDEHNKAVQERDQKMEQIMARMDGEISLYGEPDASKESQFDSFKTMLSSIANDTKDQDTATRLNDLLVELKNDGYSKDGVQRSVELMNKVAPPINTSA
ncbi:EF-hand domain-containing protein [Paraglaciecola sp. L1A13]|uniref:EF-hand domain-containing protein n=1 Tax=Paraglaciecola sp. L1A13 TaxID=2686359 RepID=UPI00131B1EF0|nr:EF-hand domain-containing protein [Paraglaciecola sp. L1A13]